MKKISTVFISCILLLALLTITAFADYSSDISSVMSSYRLNNYSCESAPQQKVNGTYRTVEMLEIIAKEVDTGNKYTSDISSVMSNYRLSNYSCESAVQ